MEEKRERTSSVQPVSSRTVLILSLLFPRQNSTAATPDSIQSFLTTLSCLSLALVFSSIFRLSILFVRFCATEVSARSPHSTFLFYLSSPSVLHITSIAYTPCLRSLYKQTLLLTTQRLSFHRYLPLDPNPLTPSTTSRFTDECKTSKERRVRGCMSRSVDNTGAQLDQRESH